MNGRERIARRVTVAGRVQGVWFRGWTVENAQSRGLHGWVRNRKDGSVEACFAGPPELVEEMIEACRNGPPTARVDALVAESAEDEGWTRFAQLPTTE
ncbi:MAG: acylphosphatase [Rhodospirillales bacterium]|nr:acylphosphatase [Rhodospirillales bacterium]